MVTYNIGTGLVVARRADGSWSPPSAISAFGIGWGAQVNCSLCNFYFSAPRIFWQHFSCFIHELLLVHIMSSRKRKFFPTEIGIKDVLKLLFLALTRQFQWKLSTHIHFSHILRIICLFSEFFGK